MNEFMVYRIKPIEMGYPLLNALQRVLYLRRRIYSVAFTNAIAMLNNGRKDSLSPWERAGVRAGKSAKL